MLLHVSSTVVLIIRRSKILLYSIWYHHTYRWPYGAHFRGGLSQPAHRTATYRVWRYQMLYNTILPSWWWAHSARNMYRHKINIIKHFVHYVWLITKNKTPVIFTRFRLTPYHDVIFAISPACFIKLFQSICNQAPAFTNRNSVSHSHKHPTPFALEVYGSYFRCR